MKLLILTLTSLAVANAHFGGRMPMMDPIKRALSKLEPMLDMYKSEGVCLEPETKNMVCSGEEFMTNVMMPAVEACFPPEEGTTGAPVGMRCMTEGNIEDMIDAKMCIMTELGWVDDSMMIDREAVTMALEQTTVGMNDPEAVAAIEEECYAQAEAIQMDGITSLVQGDCSMLTSEITSSMTGRKKRHAYYGGFRPSFGGGFRPSFGGGFFRPPPPPPPTLSAETQMELEQLKANVTAVAYISCLQKELDAACSEMVNELLSSPPMEATTEAMTTEAGVTEPMMTTGAAVTEPMMTTGAAVTEPMMTTGAPATEPIMTTGGMMAG